MNLHRKVRPLRGEGVRLLSDINFFSVLGKSMVGAASDSIVSKLLELFRGDGRAELEPLRLIATLRA